MYHHPQTSEHLIGSGKDPSPARVPQITSEMDVLEKGSIGLTELVSRLEQKLSPVTLPEPPQVNDNIKSVEMPSQTQLGESLHAVSVRLHGVYRRIQSIIERVDLP